DGGTHGIPIHIPAEHRSTRGETTTLVVPTGRDLCELGSGGQHGGHRRIIAHDVRRVAAVVQPAVRRAVGSDAAVVVIPAGELHEFETTWDRPGLHPPRPAPGGAVGRDP